MRHRHALTDDQWDRIKDLLPGKEGVPSRTAADNRTFVDAVLYVLRTAIPWEDLPTCFDRPNSVWKRVDRWCRSGAWGRIAAALNDPDLEEIQLDSCSVKAHPVASTGQRGPAEKKKRPTSGVASGGAGAA